CRKGPSTRSMTSRSGGSSVLRVVNVLCAPAIAISMLATRQRLPFSSPSSFTPALLHQGRNSGYASTSLTRSNMVCAECGTSACFLTSRIAAPRQVQHIGGIEEDEDHHHGREPARQEMPQRVTESG